jgi:hypothetical protein
MCSLVHHVSAELSGPRRYDGRTRIGRVSHDDSAVSDPVRAGVRETVGPMGPRRDLILAGGRNIHLREWKVALPLPRRRQARQDRRLSAPTRPRHCGGTGFLSQSIGHQPAAVAAQDHARWHRAGASDSQATVLVRPGSSVAEPVTQAALGPGSRFSLILRSDPPNGLFSRAASAPEPSRYGPIESRKKWP